jgi:GNAT superfamily N-acetyltransferase
MTVATVARLRVARKKMTEDEATQIAALLNERNQLVRHHTAQTVLRNAANYEYERAGAIVVGCVERDNVQWYQWEIRHLSVREDHEGKGIAFAVYKRAESAAIAGGACVLQCTIRRGNEDSERFFHRQGFTEVNSFYYEATGRTVGVWQKILRASGDT